MRLLWVKLQVVRSSRVQACTASARGPSTKCAAVRTQEKWLLIS